jgi:hypothetical protein
MYVFTIHYAPSPTSPCCTPYNPPTHTVPGPFCPDPRPREPQFLHQNKHPCTQPRPRPAAGGALRTNTHKPKWALPSGKGHAAAAFGDLHAHPVQGSSSIWAVCVALVSVEVMKVLNVFRKGPVSLKTLLCGMSTGGGAGRVLGRALGCTVHIECATYTDR